jgi:DNA mismatch repair protein MutS
MAETTPLMEQYLSIKSKNEDSILFFRLGDFYEMFRSDAVEVSALLNLTLTKRNGEPMCGIPYHASRAYISRLLKLGKKIAICEQLAAPGKGIMERKVVEIITPGTIVEEDFLDRGRNNYLVALSGGDGFLSLAMADLSTGEFRLTKIPRDDEAQALRREFFRIQPKELLVQQSLLEDPRIAAALEEKPDLVLNRYPDWAFDIKASAARLAELLKTSSLKGFGLDESSPELLSVGTLIDYLEDTAKSLLVHINTVVVYADGDFVGIDESTQKNLELTQNLQDGGKAYSLLAIIDETKTGMGARLLRDRISRPLTDMRALNRRLDELTKFYREQGLLSACRDALARILDIERLSVRIALDKAHARDLVALRDSLAQAFKLDSLLRENGCPSIMDADGKAPDLRGLEARIRSWILDEPSVLLTEGKLIKSGNDPELDSLHSLKSDSHAVLEAYLEEERQETGISTLRIRHNNIVGYFLEVSKGQLAQVPPRYSRKQSLVNGERFTTERLAELESKIGGAQERIVELEKKHFIELREYAKAYLPGLKALAVAVAGIDCAQSLAFVATRRAWVRPRLCEESVLEIKEGRHPVVEAYLPDGAFVPNDLSLGREKNRFALITGPNMAGKSTFLRQSALIALLAHLGSYVPAQDAVIGLVDRIYCRVGAQDNLARGESTFLTEMNETAYILNTATERSLVIMDEVGRGTSTTDGLSIARAVSERILDTLKARTLFATHYHELHDLQHPALVFLTLEVLENEGDIVFLKKVIPGKARSSYGIHAAQLAGIPQAVLERAYQIQQALEGGAEKGLPDRIPAVAARAEKKKKTQIGLFSEEELILGEIRSLDNNSITPLEALTRIAQWKKRLDSGK